MVLPRSSHTLALSQNDVALWCLGRSYQLDLYRPDLFQHLSTVVHRATDDAGHGYRVRRLSVPLLEEQMDDMGRPVLRFGAGLLDIVRDVLRKAGYRVLEMQRCIGLGEHHEQVLPPVPAPLPAWRGPVDGPFLKLVRHQWQGLVRYRAGCVFPATLIMQVARAWPTKTIAVACTRIEDAQRLRRELTVHLPNVDVVTGKDKIGKPHRIVVGTYTALQGISIEWRDIVFALHAREAMSVLGYKTILKAWRGRLIGLLDERAELSPGERDQLRALYGFHEVYIPRHGHQERRVEVEYQHIRGGPGLAKEINIVALKRQGVWQHPVRNRHIVRMARDARQDHNGDGVEGGGTRQRVLVVVENVEHGLAVAKRLPGWPLLADPDACTDGLQPQELAILHPSEAGWPSTPPQAIVTFAGLSRVNLADVDVLVRADGGRWLFPVNADELVQPNKETARPLRVVDVVDHHHRELKAWSRQRQQAYELRGWMQPGEDSVQTRVRQFVASRE